MNGFFLGGLSEGLNQQQQVGLKQQAINIQRQYANQEQQRFQQNQYMKLRSDAYAAMQDTITHLKNANPSWTDTQVLANGAVAHYVDMISGFDKNLGLDPNNAKFAAAGMAAGKSEIQTKAALAQASESPLKRQLTQSEINKNNAQAGVPGNPDLDTATQLGGQQKPQRTAQATATDVGNALPQIPTPMTPLQEQQVSAAGFTPATADFEAVKVAYGADEPKARSKQGGFASNIIKSRSDQYWIDRGVSPQQANAIKVEFNAMRHGALKIADIDARMTTAVGKAQQTAQILTGASGQQLIDSVSRTKFKDLNDLLVSARKRTGDQNEIRLGIALETLASNYGVALGMGNSTLTDFQTQRAQSLLQQGWDKGQLTAAIDQLQKEMVREEAGTRQALKTFVGGMQSTVRQETGSEVPSTPKPPPGFNVIGQ